MSNEVTGTATAVVGALKTQPIILGLLLIIFALLAFTYYEGMENWRQRGAYVNETQKLLARCITVEELERLQRLK